MANEGVSPPRSSPWQSSIRSTPQAAACSSHLPRMFLPEEQGVVGEIALHVPVLSDVRRGLDGGTEIKVHTTQPERHRAVVLAPGRHRKIRLQHDLAPTARASFGRCKAEAMGTRR